MIAAPPDASARRLSRCAPRTPRRVCFKPGSLHLSEKWSVEADKWSENRPDGAGFPQISARLDQWSVVSGRPVCAGAGARGCCVLLIHCSISSIKGEGVGSSQLNFLSFALYLKWSVARQVEAVAGCPGFGGDD